MAHDRPHRRSVLPASVIGLVMLASACGDAGDDGGAVATTQVVPPTTVAVDRPEVPSSELLGARKNQLPFPTDSDLPVGWPELLAAHEEDRDWTGTIAGTLMRRLPDGPWQLCITVLESYPEQCGSGVTIDGDPAVVTARPELIETRLGVESDVPVLMISSSDVQLEGTFFHDSVLFQPAE